MASPYEDALNTMNQMDQRLANWQDVPEPSSLTLPSESNPTHPGLALSESPTTGGAMEQGLGLAQRGLEAITPSRDTLYKFAQGLEAAGAVGRGATPLYMQQQHMDLQRQQLQDTANERKQMMAFRIQQAEEEKRQHNWGIAEKLIMTGNMGALEEFGKQFPDVMPIVQGVSKQHLSALPTLAKGGYLPEDVVQRTMNPKPGEEPMTPAELSVHVKMGMENYQADLKEIAKTKNLTDAINTPKEQRKPHQQLMVNEHEKKLAVQDADIELKKAQALKAKHEADVGTRPDRSLADKYHRSKFGVPFDQGTQETQTEALKDYAKANAQASQRAQLEVPDKPSPAERLNLIDDVGTLSRIDSLQSLYSAKYVGPVRGRIGAATEMLGGITEDEADFRAENATLKNQVIKMITGAQMSEPEALRIMKQIPDPENPPTVYEARLKRTRENVSMMAKKRRQILKATGIDVSGLPPLPGEGTTHPSVQNAIDEVLGK